MSTSFLDAVEKRRSYYALTAESAISKEQIQQIVEKAVRHAPSAFNSQSSRIVVLFESEHKALWHLVLETLKTIVPSDAFGKTKEKIDSFAAAYGTVLFFEEQETIKGLQAQFPTYAQNFPVWSEHASGILQYIIWTALEDAGLGANLQHYNPLIDEQVKKKWALPDSWKLIAQMPFGKITAPAGEKAFMNINERVLILGK